MLHTCEMGVYYSGMERKAERIAALVAAADRLGRKFEPQDLTRYPKLMGLARDWLADEPRPNPERDAFLHDMWMNQAQGQFLSLGQAKGVLNVIVARARYQARKAEGQAAARQNNSMLSRDGTFGWDASKVANGRYRVEFGDGSSIAIRLSDMDVENGSDWARKQPKGTRNVSLLTQGADGWTGNGWLTPGGIPQGRARTGNVCEALEILARADSTLAFGVAFARMGNQCFICGRNLDTAESIDAGYGPVCADKYGLPWGDKRTPEAVQTAREAAQAAPQP